MQNRIFEHLSEILFLACQVTGHAGKLVFGLLDKKVPAVLMVGRAQ